MKRSLKSAVLFIGASASRAEGFAYWNKNSGSSHRQPAPKGMPPLPTEPIGVEGDKDLEDILAQNRKYIEDQTAEDPEFFQKLPNKPNYFWIGCTDARVPANVLMGEPAGNVFVCRNVANMVVNTDNNLLASLQYAVAYLKVPHIIVCGHYNCGGIRAAVTRFNHMPPLENWLRNIRDVYRVHRVELDRIKDPEERHRKLVELNVVEQCVNLYKTGVVQRQRLETKKEGGHYPVPQIHGVVYDPKVGLLKRVNVDFAAMTDDLDGIYDLYEMSYLEMTENLSPSNSTVEEEVIKVAEVTEEWPTIKKKQKS
mmetsp:Transcript_1013/g.1896  ORF Transcript_1013/g.1896 Transcript_1013/m.1896 type:complete len:311 (+) Transcript_1013:52-984(+)